MKKASLIVTALLLSTAVSFAGDNKKENKKEAKKEACSKEEKSNCCAKKSTAKAESTTDLKVAEIKPSNERVQLSEARTLSKEEMKNVEMKMK